MSHLSMSRANAISMIVLIVGTGLSFVTASLFHLRYQIDTRFEFERAAHNRSKAIQRSIESGILIGKSVVGFYLASELVTRREFRDYARVFLSENSYIQAVEWVPRVMDKEQELYESETRKTFPGFRIFERDAVGQLVRAGQREEYFPVHYVEPYIENEKVIGFDLASDAARREALSYARDYNLPSSTGRISLVQGEPGHWGFLMYMPVYHNNASLESIEQRRLNLRGLIVIVFDIESLVELSLSYLSPGGVDFYIYDDSAVEEHRLLYYHDSRARSFGGPPDTPSAMPGDVKPFYADSFEVNNRRWTVEHFPAPGHFETGIRWIDLGVFIVCIFFSLLVFAYLRLVQKREHSLRTDRDLLERLVSRRTQDIEDKNKELEAYSYSIAHDLRSPLRSIAGFSQILLEDAGDKLSKEESGYLNRIVAASKHMAELIDDILELSRVTRAKLSKENVDLSEIARSMAQRLESSDEHKRNVEWEIHENIVGKGDPHLLMQLLDNLLGNAYKYSAKKKIAKIEFGTTQKNGQEYYFVRDNGIGFDMEYSDKLFDVFGRLHKSDEYEGTGIGLATVRRIVERHGGRVWAKAKVDEGATFYFSLAGR